MKIQETVPPGFCLGPGFGPEVGTHGAIREQFEAVRGHKREMCVRAGHMGCRGGSSSEGDTVSHARSRVPRGVRYLSMRPYEPERRSGKRAMPRWPVGTRVCRQHGGAGRDRPWSWPPGAHNQAGKRIYPPVLHTQTPLQHWQERTRGQTSLAGGSQGKLPDGGGHVGRVRRGL